MPVADPDTAEAPGAVELLVAPSMLAALVPVSVSGTPELAWRNADASSPSSRSALRFATIVVLVTRNGAPAAVNEGAVENVLPAVKVCAAFSSAMLPDSRASASVPLPRFEALRAVSPVPEPANVLPALFIDSKPEKDPANSASEMVPVRLAALRFSKPAPEPLKPVAVTVPLTSSVVAGLFLLMPTLPEFRNTLAPFTDQSPTSLPNFVAVTAPRDGAEETEPSGR